MKKIINLLLIGIFSISLVSGCFCSRASSLNISYKASIKYNDSESSVVQLVTAKSYVYIKYREPIDTPCYTKTEEGTYELRANQNLKYQCYDAEGNYFEKANYDHLEKEELENKTIIDTSNSLRESSSSEDFTLKKDTDFELHFIFTIKNTGSSALTIKKITKEDLTNNELIEETFDFDKSTFNATSLTTVENDYYRLNAGSSYQIEITFKNVDTSYLKESKDKKLDMTLNIIIK